jgi:plasmid stabilization system protein ParE
MTYSVVFSPEASEDLLEIYRYIAKDASPVIAQRFTDAIVNHCERAFESSPSARFAGTTSGRACTS